MIGLGSGYFTSLYNGEQWKIMLPPASLTFDMCVVDSIGLMRQAIGIGVVINLQKAKTQYTTGRDSNKFEGVIYHKWNIGIRPSYHIYVKKKFDVYGGFIVWYKYNDMSKYGSITTIPTNDATDGFKFALYAGYRYYFTKHVAFFAELETHVLWLSAGINFRFK